VHQKRLLLVQYSVHFGDVLVQVAQLQGFGAGTGVGFGVGGGGGGGGETVLGVGRGVGVECAAGVGCAVGAGGLVADGGGAEGLPGSTARLGTASGGDVAGEDACDPDFWAVSSPVAVGDGSGVPRAPMVRSVAVVALSAPAPANEPRLPSSVQSRLIAGI
jgi:hypothetical protein